MLHETDITLIASGSRVEGTIHIPESGRVHGTIKGKLLGGDRSEILIGDEGLVEGEIIGHTVLINGFVKGKIKATDRVFISRTGRVQGEIDCLTFKIEFGGYFEGTCVSRVSSPELPLAETPVS